jgi:hypothetical protein
VLSANAFRTLVLILVELILLGSLLDDMEHALAEEPGIEPAPQTEVPKRVDPIAAEWLREHLT